MKLRNTSDFDSDALRSIIRSVVREVSATMQREHPGGLVWDRQRVQLRAHRILHTCDIWVRQSRVGRGTTGTANLLGTTMRITLSGPDMAHAFWIIRHEVWHLFGIQHAHFPDAVMHCTPGALEAVRGIFGLRPDQQLPNKPKRDPKAKPSPDALAAAKLAKIEAAEKRWTTRLRRAQTALAKLKRQRTYYARKLGAETATALH